MPTLAELTLTLSHDITRNEHERTAALAALASERRQALTALPGAAVLLRRQSDAMTDAQAHRDDTLLDIEADLHEAERLAAQRRRTDEDDAEHQLRDGDDAAERARRTAEDKARSAFEAAALAIDRRDLPPGEKILARAEARRAMDRSLDAARQAFAEARLANQDRLLDERRAAVTRELIASRESRDKAAARHTAAAHVFSQAVRTSDTSLEASLAALAGAHGIIASFAEQRAGIDRRFDARAAQLHAAFRAARESAGVGVSWSRRRP